jgi:hypothetical protein
MCQNWDKNPKFGHFGQNPKICPMKKDAILGFGQNRGKTGKLSYFDTIPEFVYGKVFGFLEFG